MWSPPSKFADDPAVENKAVSPYAPCTFLSLFHVLMGVMLFA